MNYHPKLLTLCFTLSVAGLVSSVALAGAGDSFDGTYNGQSRLVAGSDPSCPAGTPISVSVTNGRFHFSWRPQQDAEVRMNADGSYSAMLTGSFASADKRMQVLPRIDGRTDGETLAGEYGTRWCKYTFNTTGDSSTMARRHPGGTSTVSAKSTTTTQ
jgi:hypothetical protein